MQDLGAAATEVSNYVEMRMRQSALLDIDNSDLLRTLGNGGGHLIDAVFYIISETGKHLLINPELIIAFGV